VTERVFQPDPPLPERSKVYNGEFAYFSSQLKDRFEIMPKQKTHKGTKKRFRVTASGKVKHRQAGTSHLAFRKSHKQRRKLRGTTVIVGVEAAKVRKALCGYSY